MRNCPQELLGCSLCQGTTLDQRCFLRSLFARIRKLTCQPDFRQIQEKAYQCEKEGLARVVRIVGQVAPSSRPFQRPCLHVKWLRVMKKELKLTFETLDCLLHQIADELAMRNYHLYLLETQAKNAAITVEGLGKEEKSETNFVKIEEEGEVQEKKNQYIKGASGQKQGEAAKISKNATVEELMSQGLQMGQKKGGVNFFFGCSFFGHSE